jgi:hypothetical protein
MNQTLSWSSIRTSVLLPAFLRRALTILAARAKARRARSAKPVRDGATSARAAPALGERINVPPIDALTALLTRKVRADPRYRHLVIVWSTLRSGERESWGSAAGYGLIPETTMRLAKAQLQELAFGRNDSRLTLLMLQMTRRISELEAKRVVDEQRLEAARARLAAAQTYIPAAAPRAKPTFEAERPSLPPSGFAVTEPMDFTRISKPAGTPAVVVMALRDGDEARRRRLPAGGSAGYAVVEIFDPEHKAQGSDTEIVDFRDTETFERPPPDEQELLPAFELLPMN